MVGEREEEATHHAEKYSEPVAENDVDEAEGEGAGGEHAPTITEERRVTMKKPSAIEKFLRVHGEEGIEEHDESSEGGCFLYEGKQAVGRQEMDGEAESGEADGIPHKNRKEEGARVAPGEELC
jgi:hypothetical protein